MARASVLQRVGGRAGVTRIIAAFYARVEGDAELRAVYPEDLGPGKAKLTLFFEQWLGGGAVYSERYGHPRLRRRHFPFVIDAAAAGRWLGHMRAAMAECGVLPEDAAVIFDRLAPLAHHMVNANDDVPREPLHDAKLE